VNILCFIFSDYIWFWLLEAFILAVFIRAIIFDIKSRIIHFAELTRGGVSQETLLSFLALAIILIEIIISSDVISNHRVIAGLLNVAVFIYLFLFSSYFTNKLIGWSEKLKKRKFYFH